MKTIIGILFIGFIINLLGKIIDWIIECIEDKDWFLLALPIILIVCSSIFVTLVIILF